MSTDRIFQGEDQQWYFSVRGNQAAGPFPSYHDADRALGQHVRNWKRRTSRLPGWPEAWKPARLLRRPGSAPRHT